MQSDNGTSIRPAIFTNLTLARTRMKRLSDKRIIQALRDAHGVLVHAAEILGCCRQTVASRIESSDAVKKVYDDLTSGNLDTAESKLLEAVDRGEPWAIKFLLENQGRKRGYGQNALVNVNNEVQVNLRGRTREEMLKIAEGTT